MATSASIIATRRVATVILPTATLYTISSSSYDSKYNTTTNCDGAAKTVHYPRKEPSFVPPPAFNVKRRMTSIGRFALQSETPQNLSNCTFFVGLSSSPPLQSTSGSSSSTNTKTTPLTTNEFAHLWAQRNIFGKHPRFASKISPDGRHFEPANLSSDEYIKETLHYNVYRSDLQRRVRTLLEESMDVEKKLWEVSLSNGVLGSSGAIGKAKIEREGGGGGSGMKKGVVAGEELETVALFRVHHAMADGVSLGAALSDLSDEGEIIRNFILSEISKQKSHTRQSHTKSFLSHLSKLLHRLLWFSLGSLQTLLHHTYLLLTTARHPFHNVLARGEGAAAPVARSVSWCDCAPVDEARAVAKALHARATVNDLFVTCVVKAIYRQLKCHNLSDQGVPKNVNVAIPVHLSGGILPPGTEMGNKIGAMVVKVPTNPTSNATTTTSSSRHLKDVSDALSRAKTSPAPLIGYLMARFCSDYMPQSVSQWMMRNANANAAVVVSNVKGSPKKLHWNGRTIESIAGFLPIPPGVPVGVVVQSYAGVISLTVTADKRAVPDADKFLGWILEEYRTLYDEAQSKKKL